MHRNKYCSKYSLYKKNQNFAKIFFILFYMKEIAQCLFSTYLITLLQNPLYENRVANFVSNAF